MEAYNMRTLFLGAERNSGKFKLRPRFLSYSATDIGAKTFSVFIVW